jgi:hypothetical protein
MTREEEEDASTDSKRNRIQQLRKIIEEDEGQKRKKHNQEQFDRESTKHISVRGTPDREAKTKVALRQFRQQNEDLGNVEKQQNQVDKMKQTVRTWGWQAFKVLSEADFLYSIHYANAPKDWL